MSKIRQALKAVLLATPVGYAVLRAYRARAMHRMTGRFSTPRERFTHYYKTNFWGDPESRSGPGSSLKYTQAVRQGIEELLVAENITTLLDAPCGDYNWFRSVKRPEALSYVGADIVAELIDSNNSQFGSTQRTTFRQLDIIHDPVPGVDLWLCRDVLFHFSNEDVSRVLRNFFASGSRLLLTSNHPLCSKNEDIPTGWFRQINLTLPPFGFPAPRASFDDWIPGFPVRTLSLWTRDDVPVMFRGER